MPRLCTWVLLALLASTQLGVYDGKELSSELKDALLEAAPGLGVQLHFYVP